MAIGPTTTPLLLMELIHHHIYNANSLTKSILEKSLFCKKQEKGC